MTAPVQGKLFKGRHNDISGVAATDTYFGLDGIIRC